ncbi:MAG: lysophospholipid acyltransferase family protein [Nocardioidaceae bacterium]
MFYWLLKFVFIGPLLKLIFRPWAEGTENVPPEGGAILASNHKSYSDWLFMPLVIPRRVTFVAKAEYFEGHGLKGWFQRTFFSGAGQVPIDRTGGRASEGAIKTGLRILEQGGLFGIYPEGTRSHDGRLYRGRTGLARMALEAKVPVVPVAVINTDVIAPTGKIFGRFARPGVRFGPALDFSRYEGMEGDRYILRAVTDEIMYEIMRLSGQEYVDLYATRAKQVEKERAKADAEAARLAAVADPPEDRSPPDEPSARAS